MYNRVTIPVVLICNGSDIELDMEVSYHIFDGEVIVDDVFFNGEKVELPSSAYEQIALEVADLI